MMKLLLTSRRALVEAVRQKLGEPRPVQRDFLKNYCLKEAQTTLKRDLTDPEARSLFSQVACFGNKYFARVDSTRKPDLFLSKNAAWLDTEIFFSHKEAIIEKKRGRPCLGVEEGKPRTKRRKVENIKKQHTLQEILLTAEGLLRESGNEPGAKILKLIYMDPTKCKEIWEKIKPGADLHLCTPLEPKEAVSMVIDGDFSKSQYCLIRSVATGQGSEIFPAYNHVRTEKQQSLPPPDSVTITSTSAEINLQVLVNMDSQKIVKLIEQEGVLPENVSSGSLVMTHKWGVDGSGSHSQYRLFLEDPSCEKNVLFTAQVPLQLTYTPQNGSPQILWKNPSPSSTKFCKPLRVQYKKETKEVLIEEESYFQKKISELEPSTVEIKNGNILKISHTFHCTMIDGKARTFLTGASSHSSCPACGAKPTSMSNRNLRVDTSVFKYGISVLHCRIRFLECVLNVSYRLDLKKWSVNSAGYAQRKEKIQEEIRRELGILVDMIEQGSGSTNNGNTARKFFQNPEAVSRITGFDLELTKRFSIIQTALSCCADIDAEKFKNYCIQTADRFEQLYPWYYMPSSVHLILIHGADIIKSLELPMGMYSEEALESNNKNIKAFKEHHTRKNSRENVMFDLFYRLLLNGDIIYSSIGLQNMRQRLHRDLPVEVTELIKQ